MDSTVPAGAANSPALKDGSAWHVDAEMALEVGMGASALTWIVTYYFDPNMRVLSRH